MTPDLCRVAGNQVCGETDRGNIKVSQKKQKKTE